MISFGILTKQAFDLSRSNFGQIYFRPHRHSASNVTCSTGPGIEITESLMRQINPTLLSATLEDRRADTFHSVIGLSWFFFECILSVKHYRPEHVSRGTFFFLVEVTDTAPP
jgi:hypothetical protein